MIKVIGLCGSIGAGKGAVSDYLVKEHGYVQISTGDIVRAKLQSMGLDTTRDNSDRISEELREKFGQTYWARQVVEKIKKDNNSKAIFDGVRQAVEDDYLKEDFGEDYVLFKVDAKPSVRFKRLKSRKRPGFPTTLEKFKEHETRQNKMFKLDKTFERASAIIDNSTTYEDLYKRITDLLKEKYPKWL